MWLTLNPQHPETSLTGKMRPQNIRRPVLNLHVASSQVKKPQTERHLYSTNTVFNSNKRIVQPTNEENESRKARSWPQAHRPWTPGPQWPTLSSEPTGSEAGETQRGDLEFQPPAGGSSQAQPGNQGFCKYSWLHQMNWVFSRTNGLLELCVFKLSAFMCQTAHHFPINVN